MTSPDPEAIARYAAAVRGAVADLGAEERAQLLEDLEAHLQEVAAETGAPLTERLGPPEAYAAELRAAYGAPPAAGRPPTARRRRRRRSLAVVLLLLVAIGAGAVWLATRSGGGAPTGQPWSYEHLRSEAAAGHVSRVVIEGGSGTATDRAGVQHAVNLPYDTAPLASELTRDGADVVYQQTSHGGILYPLWNAWLLLVLAAPVVFALVLAALVLGVLWRLYRRLGRPTGIM